MHSKLIRSFFSTLFLLVCAIPIFGQSPLPINQDQICTFDGTPIKGPIYEFAPSAATNQIVNTILDAVGLKPRFEVKAANVPNAAAMIYNNQRYILYSQQFVTQVNQITRTDWAAVSILAHEIGHHLNGHTLGISGSRPSNELEADEFSGFVLRRLGATMLEAQAAMRVFADDEASASHPQKSARLEAIAVGWTKAGEEGNSGAIVKKRNEPVYTPGSSAKTNPSPMVERPVAVNKEEMLGKVVFDASPEKDFYLTKQLQLIKMADGGKQVIGKLAQTSQSDYPFVIIGQNNRVIYLADSGILYNKDGERLGFVTKISQ